MRGANPHFVESTGFLLLGVLSRDITRDEIGTLWRRWGTTLALSRSAQPGHFYGVIDSIAPSTGRLDYGIAVVAGAFFPTPEGFTRWELPARNYAVLTTSHSACQEDRYFFYDTWLPSSGYQRADGFELEHYSLYFDEDTGSPLEIWIPIASKNSQK